MYKGPVDSKGRRLYPGSVLPGSELVWIGTFISTDGQPARLYTSMMSSMRYTSHPDRPSGWRLSQFDWDKDPKIMGLYEAFMADDNPDLRAFKAAGGKLLIYHGLTDQLVIPDATIDYYKTVERVMGGPAQTADFARLFLIPGLNHCNGGAGATVFDYVKYLDDWVAGGKAPDMIVGAHLKEGAPLPGGVAMKQPIDPANVAFTRPVYAYPLMAKYKGSGDANDAANFAPAQPGR
jgi:feruloyl esterase